MSIPRTHRRELRAVASVVLALGLTFLTACSAGSQHGELAENKQIATTCPSSGTLASFIAVDGSASGRSRTVADGQLRAIETVVRRTAVCSGVLKVIVFSFSSAGTASLYEGSLAVEGATENARLKRVPGRVASVMQAIRGLLTTAIHHLPENGSDPTGQYRLANEWRSQLAGQPRLNLVLLTDGFDTGWLPDNVRALSAPQAEAVANRVTVPKLTGASVTVAGLGHVAGTAPSSVRVEGLVAFYDRLCERTAAAHCVSVTDFAAVTR